MFRHRFDQAIDRSVIVHWLLLSFNGGAINAGGFLATGKFVSHVTGFATMFGTRLGALDLHAAFGFLSVPVFFLFGAFLAGLLIYRFEAAGRRPRFDWIMLLSAACLFLCASGGELAQFEKFGTKDLGLGRNYILLALLCLSCGLQNGTITAASDRSVRATHLTGITTDLGLGLSRIVTQSLVGQKAHNELRFSYLRAATLAAFTAGSAAGAFVFMRFGYSGFVLPALICCYVAWRGKT